MTHDLHRLQPQHPALYRLAPDGASLEFFYVRCPACARLSFPANVPGCSHCGDPLANAEQVIRPGGGTLLECVTLHVALLPGMEVPRIAADILLEDGLVEEGVVAGDDDSALRIGMALRAIAVPMPDGAHFACRFVPAQGGAA